MLDVPSPAGSEGAKSPRLQEVLCDPALGARRLEVPAAASLYTPDAPARNLYHIHAGQIRLFLIGPDGSERLVGILGAGDWFGVPALAGAVRYGARADAFTRAAVCEIPAARLMSVLPRFPDVAVELIRQLAVKVQEAHEAAANLVFDDTKDRLIKALLHLSRSSAASPNAAGDGIDLRITHEELAENIGAARETVSLTLTQLRQRNLLRTGRNRLSFNPGALERFYRRGSGSQVEQGEPAT